MACKLYILLSCSIACNCLLLFFLLRNHQVDCNGLPFEHVQIPIDSNLERPELKIPQGAIRGVTMVTHHNRTFYGFKGIPFAQPPVGDLRFKAPKPANPWNGTLDGGKDSSPCPQLNPAFLGDEDCLYLNVYTPRLPHGRNSTLLPVMMFVYGGGFKTGTNNPGQLGPQYILNKDVVLVVPSYRTGVLGYLSTGDEVAPGNYGLKDLVEALEWTRRNIQYFGGDPEQVTFFGESAGAISVHILTLSKLTEGLFHRYITDSGSALTAFIPIPRTKLMNSTNRLARHLGCPTNTSTSLVSCLRGLNASQLIETNRLFLEWYVMPLDIWCPTIEPDIEGAIITDTPRNLIAAGKVRDLPWLCAINQAEGLLVGGSFHVNQDLQQDFFDNFDSVLPIILQFDGIVENKTAYIAALKSYYLNDLTADRSILLNNFTQLMGDIMFIYPGYKGVMEQVIHAKNPVYLSSFEYRGTASYSYAFSGGSTENLGASHGDDLIYLFSGPHSQFGPPGAKFSENDWRMVETMVELWTSFAIQGTPTTSSPNGTVAWEPYSSRKSYLRIGNGPDPVLEVKHGYLEERMNFLNELNAATSWL